MSSFQVRGSAITRLRRESRGVLERVGSEGDGRGFNAATGVWVDMFKSGIIDPAKVARSALQHVAAGMGGHGGYMH